MSCCEAEIFNMCIQQGATYTKVFTWWGPVYLQGVLSEGPINITGWTAALQIRAYPLASTVLYDASGDLVINGSAGQITLTIPASATETFTWWNGVYDLKLTSQDGSYSMRLTEGTVTVSPGVTS